MKFSELLTILLIQAAWLLAVCPRNEVRKTPLALALVGKEQLICSVVEAARWGLESLGIGARPRGPPRHVYNEYRVFTGGKSAEAVRYPHILF